MKVIIGNKWHDGKKLIRSGVYRMYGREDVIVFTIEDILEQAEWTKQNYADYLAWKEHPLYQWAKRKTAKGRSK